jgi:hypothetical protein
VGDRRGGSPTRLRIAQDTTAFAGRKLLLDGQQRLTSLTAVLNGELVTVRRRKRPIDILFNLAHPEGPPPGWKSRGDEQSPLTTEDEVAEEYGEVAEADADHDRR